jgi:hypothetical protein
MSKSFKAALFMALFFFTARNVLADEIVLSWSVKDVQGINERAVEAAARLGVEEIARKNLSVASWPDAFLLMVGANQHKADRALHRALAAQLTDTAKADLKETGKLIIWERITTGEIAFEGRGYQISDDLFTVAGRANWMLRNTTKKNFGYVKPATTAEELAGLQQKWVRWLSGEQVEEQIEEFVPPGKASHEMKRGITSLEALEALIASLKPPRGEEKRKAEELKEKCAEIVRGIYGMNADPHTLEMCRPTMLTQGYLAFITGIKNKHGYDWWKKWWETNKDRLVWNREKGIFQVRK